MYKYKGMIQDCHVKWWTIDNLQEYKIIMHTHNKGERKKVTTIPMANFGHCIPIIIIILLKHFTLF